MAFNCVRQSISIIQLIRRYNSFDWHRHRLEIMGICVLFHDAFFDYALEIFWSEKCAVLLKNKGIVLFQLLCTKKMVCYIYVSDFLQKSLTVFYLYIILTSTHDVLWRQYLKTTILTIKNFLRTFLSLKIKKVSVSAINTKHWDIKSSGLIRRPPSVYLQFTDFTRLFSLIHAFTRRKIVFQVHTEGKFYSEFIKQ